MRINKFIAQSGETSRRKADELIAEGRVKVNRVTLNEPGYDVVEGDVVEVDGRVIGSAEKKVYYLLNKPVGYVTTVSDDKERYTVMDLMSDVEERVFPVGRLDYNTSGMLNDILDIEKIRSGTIKIYPEVIDATLIIEKIRTVVQARVSEKRLAFEIDDSLTNGIQYAKIDVRRVEQVLLNIIVNAIKYTPKGGKVRWEGHKVVLGDGRPAVAHVKNTAPRGRSPRQLE